MYDFVRSYSGPTPIQALALRLESLHPPTGESQWSSHVRSDEVQDLWQPDLKETFPGHWKYCFVNVLYPMGVLHPHQDGALPEGIVRYHLVLQTTPFSWCFHENWQQLDEGGIYTIDPSKMHYAVNLGDKPRIHLIIDLEAS